MDTTNNLIIYSNIVLYHLTKEIIETPSLKIGRLFQNSLIDTSWFGEDYDKNTLISRGDEYITIRYSRLKNITFLNNGILYINKKETIDFLYLLHIIIPTNNKTWEQRLEQIVFNIL